MYQLLEQFNLSIFIFFAGILDQQRDNLFVFADIGTIDFAEKGFTRFEEPRLSGFHHRHIYVLLSRLYIILVAVNI